MADDTQPPKLTSVREIAAAADFRLIGLEGGLGLEQFEKRFRQGRTDRAAPHGLARKSLPPPIPRRGPQRDQL